MFEAMELSGGQKHVQRDANSDTVSTRQAVCAWSMWRVAIYGMIVAFAYQMPDIIAPVIGQDYFKDKDDSNNCNASNSKYAYYNGIFSSVAGIFGFLCQGYVGQLSDRYGRQKLMVFIWFTMFLSIWWLTITRNIWVYLVLLPLGEMGGTFGGIPTVLQSSLSDVIHADYRTFIYAVLYGCSGIVVVAASVLVQLVQKHYGITVVMITYDGVMLIALLWLLFVYKETLPVSKRIAGSNESGHVHPFKALSYMRENNVVFWIAIIALFTGLPESGINRLMTSYCYDLLNLCDDNAATQFSANSTIAVGLSLLCSQLLILPYLSRKLSDFYLFCIGLASVLMFCVCGIVLYLFPSVYVGYLLFALFGVSYITSPITSGALSRRLDATHQGIGLGVLHSMKGITWGVAPYLFGALYNLFEHYGMLKTMPFIVAAVFIIAGYFVLFGPLRRALNVYDQAHSHKEHVDDAHADNVIVVDTNLDSSQQKLL